MDFMRQMFKLMKEKTYTDSFAAGKEDFLEESELHLIR